MAKVVGKNGHQKDMTRLNLCLEDISHSRLVI